ncbi:MAG: hypothetical protein HY652_12310 [Acidobacteria bacterium]|nr:hypothetical protein [Acidobacteriota bacterium]
MARRKKEVFPKIPLELPEHFLKDDAYPCGDRDPVGSEMDALGGQPGFRGEHSGQEVRKKKRGKQRPA